MSSSSPRAQTTILGVEMLRVGLDPPGCRRHRPHRCDRRPPVPARGETPVGQLMNPVLEPMWMHLVEMQRPMVRVGWGFTTQSWLKPPTPTWKHTPSDRLPVRHRHWPTPLPGTLARLSTGCWAPGCWGRKDACLVPKRGRLTRRPIVGHGGSGVGIRCHDGDLGGPDP
jgi:hypothetical protein